MDGHLVHLWEEFHLARVRRRMPLIKSPDSRTHTDPSNVGLMTIDMLSDNVLVEIFDFYVNVYNPFLDTPNAWHTLVHVCRRWRYIVFASPHRLNLRLEYEGHQPLSKILDAWPVLPVILRSSTSHPKSDRRWNNLVATLESEHYNRICEISITDMPKSRWERFAAAMQKPFSGADSSGSFGEY